MDEKELYKEIVRIWGEYGAHAEIYRELCKRAGVTLENRRLSDVK